RGRKAERAAPAVARDDRSLDLRRPAEQVGGALDLPRPQVLPDLRRRDVLEQRDRARLEAEVAEEREVASALAAETEVGARDDDLGADRPQVALRELLGLECREFERELDDERLADAGVGEQLQAPLQGRQQLD